MALTHQLKAYALSHEADLIGITAYQPIWTFEGYPDISERWVVMLGVVMDHERLNTAPRGNTIANNTMICVRLNPMALAVAANSC